MDIRKQRIEQKMYNVCYFEDYVANPEMYDQSLTAVEVCGYAYPLRSRYDTKPGIYVGKDISIINYPEDRSMYSVSNNVIDFNNLNGIRDAMNKEKMVKDMENEILSNSNNVTHYTIHPDDKPMMKGLKEAWNKKNADFDSYSSRFGPNFNNDKRLFNKHDISLLKSESICTNTDIKITVIFEDMNPNVPNPMGEPVTIVLNGEDRNNEQDYTS